MRLIATLESYATLVLVTLVILMLVVSAIVFYLLRIKKIATEEEILDYSHFERRDASEYAKFNDIVSSGNGQDKNAPGMITLGKNMFIGGIEVTGYNFHSASADERERTMINMIAFFNVVDDSIQVRQTVRAINIKRNIDEVKDNAIRIEKEIISLKNDYNTAADALEDEENITNDAKYESITATLRRLMRTIRSKEWQLKEAREIVYYMEAVSSASVNMQKVNQIMFSYIYNPDEDIEALSEAEIYLKAERELANKAAIYGGALENCGCSWRQLSADDLTDLLRRHYHPKTVDDIRLDELLNSSYSALYVTSDSLADLERERRGDLEYAKEVQRLMEEDIEKQKAAEKARLEEVKRMTEEAAAVV